MHLSTALRPAALAILLLAAACTSTPTSAPPGPVQAAKPAPAACLREGQACNRDAAICCSGMICVGGDAGACMPAN